MQKIYFLSLFLLAQVAIFAQSETEQIKQTVVEYMAIVENKDYQKTMDYLYPKLFEIVPKSIMKEALQKQAENTDVVIEIDNSTIQKVSKILLVNGVKYALVDYSFLMTMIISEKDKDGLETMKVLFEAKYGKEKVVLNREKRTLGINVSSAAYLIRDPQYDGWKFLERKEEMLPLLGKILPKKVLKKLK